MTSVRWFVLAICLFTLLGWPAASNAQIFRFAQAIYDCDYDPDPNASANFAAGFASRTSYPVDYVGFKHFYELDPSIELVFVVGHNAFTLSTLERQGLAAYLGRGGLVWFDDCNNTWGSAYSTSVVAEMNALTGVTYAEVPASHQIFNSFYTLGGTPATEWDSMPIIGWEYAGGTRIFFSEEDYSCGLNLEGSAATNEASMQMAINFGMFAMRYLPTPTPAPVPAFGGAGLAMLIALISLAFWIAQRSRR